jgi:pyruvate/2-oxoglutarate dehydrogenase complex dihydrolipoamide dehydrogenase (E3) component
MNDMNDQKHSHDFDVCVIGGGSGGYAAARTARDAGLSVAVVDGSEKLGGLCILRGCMPTKTLLHAADVLHTARHHAADLGLIIPEAGYDWQKVFARKKFLVDDWAGYRAEQLEDERLHLVRKSARFIDPHTLEFGDGETLSAAHFVIATGSRVSPPPIQALETIGCIDSDDALALEQPPKSMIVLGAGPVALEFAQFFARMDVKVTVIQRSPHILSPFDTDAAEVIETVLRREGIEVFTGTKLVDAAITSDGKSVSFEHEGGVKTVTAETVLLAIGRSPNTASLDLDKAGVETDPSGRILVNARQQSSASHIFAAGDCCGPHEVVHLAVRQGEIAGHNIIHPNRPLEMDYRLLINVVFTEPQVATVGMTEKQCEAAGLEYRVASYPFGDHGKSVIFGAMDGFVKIIADAKTGEILGAACVGPHGGELIHEVMVAMHARMTVHDFALLPHYHPTLAEIWTYPAEELVELLES